MVLVMAFVDPWTCNVRLFVCCLLSTDSSATQSHQQKTIHCSTDQAPSPMVTYAASFVTLKLNIHTLFFLCGKGNSVEFLPI